MWSGSAPWPGWGTMGSGRGKSCGRSRRGPSCPPQICCVFTTREDYVQTLKHPIVQCSPPYNLACSASMLAPLALDLALSPKPKSWIRPWEGLYSLWEASMFGRGYVVVRVRQAPSPPTVAYSLKGATCHNSQVGFLGTGDFYSASALLGLSVRHDHAVFSGGLAQWFQFPRGYLGLHRKILKGT